MAQVYDHWMAFDFGTQRIGIAVGQRITGKATPIEPIILTSLKGSIDPGTLQPNGAHLNCIILWQIFPTWHAKKLIFLFDCSGNIS